jgi:hypothetical protein
MRSVVVDGMHNIFEGLVAYHCCVVLGIDTPDAEPAEEKPADPRQVAAAIKLFEKGATHHTLERFTIPVLKALCFNNNISLPDVEGKTSKKSRILDVLQDFLVSRIYKWMVQASNYHVEQKALQYRHASASSQFSGPFGRIATY